MESAARLEPVAMAPPAGPKYQAEELLAMRKLATNSAGYLEKLMEEGCLKHLMLKSAGLAHGPSSKHDASRSGHSSGSACSAGASSRTIVSGSIRSSKDHSAGSNPTKKASPSPSIKRGKAERLLKEHGSPPGMRVTAGGRIVPTDFTPLGTPHLYGPRAKIALQRDGDPTVPHGFIGYDHKGQLYQKIGTALVPVKTVNGIPQFYTPPINPFQPVSTAESGGPGQSGLLSAFPLGPVPLMPGYPVVGSNPFTGFMLDGGLRTEAQIAYLESEYGRLDKERQEFERFEVLKKESLPPSGREELVNRKRKYVLDLDQLRKSIKTLKALLAAGSGPAGVPFGSSLGQTQFSAQGTQIMPPFPLYPPSSLGMFPPGPRFFAQSAYSAGAADPPLGSFGQFAGLSDGQVVSSPMLAEPVEPKPPTGPRRSHAVEITNPASRTKSRRGLDPTSPDYIPGKPVAASGSGTAGPTPAGPTGGQAGGPSTDCGPSAPTEPLVDSASGLIQTKTTNSSVTTSAFFPVNTHEHSSKPSGPKTDRSSQPNTEVVAAPVASTAAKTWDNSTGPLDRPCGTDSSGPAGCPALGDGRAESWKHGSRAALVADSDMRLVPVGAKGDHADASILGLDQARQLIRSDQMPPGTESFLDGYCDGLSRKAPSPNDKTTDYLNGYCQGLHRSQKRSDAEFGWSSEESKAKPAGMSSTSFGSDSRGPVGSASESGRAGIEPGPTTDDDPAGSTVGSGWMVPEAARLGMSLPAFDAHKRGPSAVAAAAVAAAANSGGGSFAPSSSPLSLSLSLSSKRQSGSNVKGIKHYPGNAVYGAQPFTAVRPSVSTGPIYNQRGWPSGCDGVMDDIGDSVPRSPRADRPMSHKPGSEAGPAKAKGRSGAASSSAAPTADAAVATPSSPKKSSPAKTKLEQIAHKVRRKDASDEATKMTPDDRRRRWRIRFEKIKRTDQEEIREYQDKNPLPQQ